MWKTRMLIVLGLATLSEGEGVNFTATGVSSTARPTGGNCIGKIYSDGSTEKCFWVTSDFFPRGDAEKRCAADGGRLATIKDSVQATFIYTSFYSYQSGTIPLWVGSVCYITQHMYDWGSFTLRQPCFRGRCLNTDLSANLDTTDVCGTNKRALCEIGGSLDTTMQEWTNTNSTECFTKTDFQTRLVTVTATPTCTDITNIATEIETPVAEIQTQVVTVTATPTCNDIASISTEIQTPVAEIQTQVVTVTATPTCTDITNNAIETISINVTKYVTQTLVAELQARTMTVTATASYTSTMATTIQNTTALDLMATQSTVQQLSTPVLARTALSQNELTKKIDEIQVELVVETKSLSSRKRKKKCATDSRISSTSVGISGLLVIVVPFFACVIMDIPRYYHDLRKGVSPNECTNNSRTARKHRKKREKTAGKHRSELEARNTSESITMDNL